MSDPVLPKEELQGLWDKTSFGDLVRDMRKCEGWTQEELADRLGIPAVAVCRIEQGWPPSQIMAKMVAKAFGMDHALFVQKAIEAQEYIVLGT